jgi:lipopolysaccharide export system protein LptA
VIRNPMAYAVRPHSLLLLSSLLLFCGRVYSQRSDSLSERRAKTEEYKPLKLDAADEIQNQRVEGKDVLRGTGHVRFSQDTITATCDQSAFFRDIQMAILIGHVVMNDRHRTIYCDKAKYFAKQKKAVCRDNVVFVDRATTLVSDSLVYFQNIEQLVAQGRVVIFDSTESATIYGQEAFYDVNRKYAAVKGHPFMIQFDSTHYKGENVARLSRGMESHARLDSLGKPMRYKADEQLSVRGLFVESFTDSHKVIIKDSVLFTREKLITTSSHAVYHTKKEVLEIEGSPVATYEKSQMVGDSMVVKFHEREIRSIDIKGNAVASSDADSSGNKTNRLRAKEIVMNIRDKKLNTMEARGNAYNLYFLENKEGVNEISGPGIILYFNDKGRLNNFKVLGGTEGTYYPEKFENQAGKK